MEKKESFKRAILKIALPVTLQSLLQSSFSVIDQVMIGRLGKCSIAGIGLGGKFISLYSVVLAAITTAAGIMISQYMGKKDEKSVSWSFVVNTALSIGLAAVFLFICMAFPEIILGVYTKDEATKAMGASYIRILAISFLPMAISAIVTTMLRCMELASLPLYASVFALLLNTGLNYLLIFGKGIFPAMGVEGAAWASVISQIVSCGIILALFRKYIHKQEMKLTTKLGQNATAHKESWRKYIKILCPILICEFLWSLGENVYSIIYGNMGTDACAAITMTVPIQTLMIGALSGLSQAAGILIGKSLGAKEYEKAYIESKKLMKYGLMGSILLSWMLVIVGSFYVKIYDVEAIVQQMTRNVLVAFALISPVKVQNMILGGGIIRSGGKTEYVMWIDIIGTWLFGVPLGFLSAFVWDLPIAYVYFILSLEECVRLGISLIIFKKKIWMESLQ